MMSGGKPGLRLRLLLVWTAVVMTLVWLPLLRGPMDGPSYEWAWPGAFRGRGIAGDYWVLLVTAALGLAVLWLGWRGARRPVHLLLPLWHLPPAAVAVWLWWTQPHRLRFRGDTMGIDVSLGGVAAALFAGMFLLAVVWAALDWPRSAGRRALPLARRGRGLLLVAALLLPVEFVLLRFGTPHGPTDVAGVTLILIQWVLINVALAAREKRALVSPA